MNLELLRDYAMQFVGIPYIWGGKTPMQGEDCSGFVSEVLKFGGILKAHDEKNAQMIYDQLKTSSATLSEPQLGAVAFYGSSLTRISHIVFCVDGFRAIGSNGGDSDTNDVKEAIRDQAYIRGLPVRYRKDLVAILLPNYP